VVRAGSALDGATVGEASAAHGAATILVARQASGEPLAFPAPDVRFAEGDRVVVLGPLRALDAMGR